MSDKSVFLPLLNDYVNTYLPVGIGVQPNTIKSYKYAFRLLIEFMYEKNSIAADAISFEDLDYDTLTGFFEWILKERKCSETTRNQRLAVLLSFSKYAQNRDFDAAAVFRNSIIRIPLSKPRGKRRTWFTAEEMKILLALPDDRTDIGLRDKMILMTLYVTGARSQELCDLTVSCVRKKTGQPLNLMARATRAVLSMYLMRMRQCWIRISVKEGFTGFLTVISSQVRHMST